MANNAPGRISHDSKIKVPENNRAIFRSRLLESSVENKKRKPPAPAAIMDVIVNWRKVKKINWMPRQEIIKRTTLNQPEFLKHKIQKMDQMDKN